MVNGASPFFNFSIAPKNLFGLCITLASTPQALFPRSWCYGIISSYWSGNKSKNYHIIDTFYHSLRFCHEPDWLLLRVYLHCVKCRSYNFCIYTSRTYPLPLLVFHQSKESSYSISGMVGRNRIRNFLW